MKYIVTFVLLSASLAFAEVQKYETVCKKQDCFRYGWVTKSKNFILDTHCKSQSCTKNGWASVANDNSTYDVSCREGGCFKEGWRSIQNIKGKALSDDATCRYSSCLKYGWTVKTGYDFFGGNTICNLNDCSKFGGASYWRGRPSNTVCYGGDCYKNGWTLYVY